MKKFSITTKLTLFFILFTAIVLAAFSIPAYLSSRASLRDATTSELLSTALEKQAALNAWNADREHSIEDIARQADLRELVATLKSATDESIDTNLAYSDLKEELENWAGEGHRFLHLSVIDDQTGRIVASTDTDEEGQNVNNESYFTSGKQAPYIENPYYDQFLQQVSMTAAAPLYSSDGRLIAVLAGPTNLNELNSIIQRRTGLHQTDESFLVNTSTLLVTQPRHLEETAVLQRHLETEAVNQCLERTSGSIEADDYRGVPAIIVYHWLQERQLCLIVKIDQQEAFAPIKALGQTMAFAGFVILIIGSLIAFLMSHFINKPILQLSYGAEKIAQGTRDYRIDVKARNDEIGLLGHQFNQMAAAIEENEKQLKDRGIEMEQRVKDRTAELDASEKRYRLLSETSPDMIFVIDRNDQVQYVNSLAAQQFRKTPEDVIGKPRTALFPPSIAEGQSHGLQQVFNSGHPLSSESAITFPGRRIWLDTTLVPIHDETGEVSAVMGVSRNTTERRQAEEALAEQHAFLRQVIDMVPNQLFVRNREGMITLANQAMAEFHGATVDELMGTHDDNRGLDIEQMDKFRAEDIAVMDSCQPIFTLNEEIISPRGDKQWFQVYKYPLLDLNGKSDQVLCILIDVTERKAAETALAEQHDFLRQVLDIVPNQLFVRNREGFITLANKSMADFYGTTVEKLIGTSDRNHNLSLEQVKKFRAEDCSIMDTCQPLFTMNEEIIAPNGETCWVQVHKRPLIGSDGKSDQVLIALIDVTQRKLAEETLVAQHTYLKQVLDISPNPMFARDRDGIFTLANRAMAEFYGTTVDELIGTKDVVYQVDDVLERKFREEDHAVMESGQGVSVLGEEIITRLGNKCWVQSYKQPLFNPDGKCDQVLVALVDITHHKEAERAIQEEKVLSDSIINSLPGIFYMFDTDGRFLRWNTNFEEVSGYNTEEMVERHPADFFVGEEKQTVVQAIQEVFVKGESSVEAHFTSRNGISTPYFLTGVRIEKNGQHWLLGTGMDITSIKEAEQKLEKAVDDLGRSNAELERFAYVASHDLQEPLRMVTSYLQLLERRYKERLDSDALEFINYAVDGSNRMKTLINDLLAYSRVGSRGIDLTPTDCETALANVLNNLQIAIEETNANISHDVLPQVMGDAGQIAQLFQNIIGNAIKFRGDKPPHIHIGVQKDGDDWLFSITDNGIGLEPQYFERVFIIFQRLHSRGEYTGTGIGLAISKRIAERHGGRIWIESEPGNGSTFFFTIPIMGD
jgi:PAS domain S-box-containing protein